MSILQISKIQARSGNLVDLPQLDEAEFGWATDDKRLFIGKTTPNENVEILTAYSNISYSQITGSVGNLNINPTTVANGQPLIYDGNNWVNRGGLAGGLITLGTISNVKITGGAIGYVLETDGLGNLSWAPKGTLLANIKALSNANPIVMSVANTIPFVNGSLVTITGVAGTNANTILNSKSFYLTLANDYPTSGNVSLYTDVARTTGANGFFLTATANTGIATSVIASGGGSNAAQGSNTTIQFNNNNLLSGSTDLTFNFAAATKILAVNGNANVGNLNATGVSTAGRFISNIATGTAPFTVTSTTQVANLNVATAGTVTTNAQPNITSVGTLTALSINGTVLASAFTANTGVFTGNGNGLSSIVGANVVGAVATATNATTSLQNTSTATTVYPRFTALSANGNSASIFNTSISANLSNASITATTFVGALSGTATSATTAGTVTTNAQPNITSVGTLSSVTITANATVGGIKTDNYYYANGVVINLAGSYSNSNVASYLPTFTGTVGATALTTGANTTIGTITGNWSLSAGSRLSATYADLAEYYIADDVYQPGTVLEFGGQKEVTIASNETNKIAGVVTTNPAFIMNENCSGLAIAIALQGRTPCKVTGAIYKGDMLVSAGNGYAKASSSPEIGTVIGKSLENFNGTGGIIEVAIGKT